MKTQAWKELNNGLLKLKCMKPALLAAALFAFLIIGSLLACDVCDSEDLTPKTILVPDDYQSIQLAIDAANNFDVILVKNGLYKEHIQIHKPLQVFAEGNSAAIQWSGGGHVVLIGQCYDVVFEGFVVNGSGNPHWAGIRVEQSTNITIANNTVINGHRGVWLWDTQHCTFRGNHMYENTVNLEVWGLTQAHFTHNIDESNTVEAKPVYYWVNQKNRQIPPDAGYVAIVNSSNIIVKDLHLAKNAHGVLLAHANNCRVENVSLQHNVRGIQVVISDNNTFQDNTISDCAEAGIVFTACQNNTIFNNHIERNEWAVWFSFSPQLIKRRTTRNLVNRNCIQNNRIGIFLSESHNNTVINNIISENGIGFQLSNSNNNSVYHNNFLNNTLQVATFGSNLHNMWDNSYPSGGNQWSDYSEVDVKSGHHQNEPHSDGLGDVPYLLYGSVYDRYPLSPPKIDFSFRPSPAKVSDTVFFEGVLLTSHSSIISWAWRLGDSSILSGQNVTHTFSKEGSYNVSLTVTDSRNAVTIIEKEVNLANSSSEDADTVIVAVIIAVALAFSIAFTYSAWKLLKR
ncbi:MAG: right-handed parallel beta-helix repeat-containing protein [Candidatus Bathyarchaeota archaeon]|nr:MAG: right-handed parallel beta-helix repeat-containing protein [Candidatus Bathyarchaeota archaeon]